MNKLLPNLTLNFRALFSIVALIFSVQAYALDDTSCGSISGFEFSNGNTSTSISNNQSFYIGDLPNNFYLNLLVDGYSSSAKFRVTNLNTGQCYYITENQLPYTFPGGNCAWNFGCGDFEVKAKLYKYSGCSSWCDTETINFSISCSQPCGDISGFEFSNGSETVSIVNNGQYDLDTLPNNFYVDLLVDGQSESSSLKLENLTTGDVYNVGENYLPYTIPGGNAAWSYGTGDFKLRGQIFEFDYCQGDACDEQTIYFSLTEPPTCGTFDDLVFSNGTENVSIAEGGVYNVSDLPLDFYVDALVSEPSDNVVYSVVNTDTNVSTFITENYLPYTYPAGEAAWDLGVGNYQIVAHLYATATGDECDNSTTKLSSTNTSNSFTAATTKSSCDDNTPTCLALCQTLTRSFSLVDVIQCAPVDAGTGSLSASVVLVFPGIDFFATITPNGDATLPQGYQLGTVLTRGNGLTIQEVSNTSTIRIPEVGGDYKIHMLAYDPTTLNLNDINLGSSTAFDIIDLIDNNQVCADLDEVGNPLLVIIADSTDRVGNSDNNPTKGETNVVSKVEEASLVSEIKLYPNPVVNQLNVDITLFEGEVLDYTMVDLNGKQVLSGSISNNTNVISTKQLVAGLYILKLKSEGRSFTKKILVNK
ncbi:T9SS type A sorting domain-containing protein [Olleya sp. R77988]|uniref:T9SS type A sorting domain-containing protein n=1 Tax=Olleya sp. R77988 TaxID=3093875 RepID=UPI0037CC4E4A